jgi:hypothetical protein
MILKVEDALKPFSRTDPDCEAHRDLWVIFPAACRLRQSFSDGALRYDNYLPIYTSTALL